MPSVTYSAGTVIGHVWLNEVNVAVFTTIPTLAPLISPAFTTPSLGVATATSINKNIFTTPASNATWSLASGKVFGVLNSMSLSAVDGSALNIGTGGTLGTAAYTAASSYATLNYSVIAVAGQTNLTPSSPTDTLTIVAGGSTVLTTNPGSNSLTITTASNGLTLLANLVPTVAARVNFLSTFTASYDNYLIEVQGILPVSDTATTTGLQFQLAVGGVANSGTIYYNALSGASSGAATTQGTTGMSNSAAGKGLSGNFYIFNTNDSTNDKQCMSHLMGVDATTAHQFVSTGTQFNNSSVVTGISFFWGTGANFVATGRIRVYGISNT